MAAVLGHLANNPYDFENLDGITDPEVFDREFHKSIRTNLQSGGFLPPTDGVTKPIDNSETTEGFFESIINGIFQNKGPEAFDTPEDTYSDRRFDFISAESRYSETVHKDELGRNKIGYGFNLDSPELRSMAKDVLSLSDEQIQAISDGTRGISSRDARVLYEARVARAEAFVRNKFKGTTLGGNQQMALVSLAYQNEGLIGPKLTKAIQEGRWKDAEHEIRNRSNRYKKSGIAERRNREADLFRSMIKEEDDDSWDIGSLFSFGSAQASEEPPQGNTSFTDKVYDFFRDFGQEEIDEVREKAPVVHAESINPIMGMIPSHVRMVIEDVMKNSLGIDQSDEIKTSDFFNDEELTTIMSLVRRDFKQNGGKKKGAVEYSDYDKGMSDVAFSSNELGLMGDDPQESIKKTLGQFTWEVNKKGEVIITDTYNFNDAKQMQKRFPSGWDKGLHLMGLTGKLFKREFVDDTTHAPMGMYGIVRRAAALYGSPEGEGAQFRINLGKVVIDEKHAKMTDAPVIHVKF